MTLPRNRDSRRCCDGCTWLLAHNRTFGFLSITCSEGFVRTETSAKLRHHNRDLSGAYCGYTIGWILIADLSKPGQVDVLGPIRKRDLLLFVAEYATNILEGFFERHTSATSVNATGVPYPQTMKCRICQSEKSIGLVVGVALVTV